MSDKLFQTAGGQSVPVSRKPQGVFSVKVDNAPAADLAICSETTSIDAQTQRVIVSNADGKQQLFWVYARGNKRILSWPGGSMEIESSDLTEGSSGAAGSIKPLKLTMPGKVLSIKVKEGDVVETGQALAIVEAMKMENLLVSSARAKVAKVHVKEGDRLESGTLLISFSEA